mgnify:CR=1 FL=1
MQAFQYYACRVIYVKNLTVRLGEETFREIEALTKLEKCDKSTLTRRLLAIGLQEMRKRQAISLYREGKCTLWKAAQIAGIPLREMIEILKEEKIPIHVFPEDVDEAWGKAFEEG